ncbi:hypothetical protein GmHk_19G053644 [Glycine max]|nr:hypothetical protein GmHk_19G053644 [Glycine max]
MSGWDVKMLILYWANLARTHLTHWLSESAYNVELWGVYESLKMARKTGIEFVKLQVDSLTVVHSISTLGFGNASD